MKRRLRRHGLYPCRLRWLLCLMLIMLFVNLSFIALFSPAGLDWRRRRRSGMTSSNHHSDTGIDDSTITMHDIDMDHRHHWRRQHQKINEERRRQRAERLGGRGLADIRALAMSGLRSFPSDYRVGDQCLYFVHTPKSGGGSIRNMGVLALPFPQFWGRHSTVFYPAHYFANDPKSERLFIDPSAIPDLFHGLSQDSLKRLNEMKMRKVQQNDHHNFNLEEKEKEENPGKQSALNENDAKKKTNNDNNDSMLGSSNTCQCNHWHIPPYLYVQNQVYYAVITKEEPNMIIDELKPVEYHGYNVRFYRNKERNQFVNFGSKRRPNHYSRYHHSSFKLIQTVKKKDCSNNNLTTHVFSVVRNPLTRIISKYLMMDCESELNDWIWNQFLLLKHTKNVCHSDCHFLPQYLYVLDSSFNPAFINHNNNNHDLYHHRIIKYENLTDELNDLMNEYGIIPQWDKVSLSRPLVGRAAEIARSDSLHCRYGDHTRTEDHIQFLNQSTLQLIHEFYQRDFQVFGYDK